MAFDTSANIQTNLRREGGITQLNLRWPTDDEWVARSKAWSIQIQRRGRGISETQIDTSRADSTLYVSIRSQDSPDLDPDEAARVVEAIARCEINDVALEMDQATVEMTIIGGQQVKHRLKTPSAGDVTKWKRASVRLIDKPHGRQEMRTNMQPSLDLYAKCQLGVDGYTNGVPAIHKEAALRAVIEACEMEAEASKDEDF